jgi:hypothetical protein
MSAGAPRVTFASLPPALVLHIFSLLPVDTRLRCAEVCRAWRAAADEPALWTALDLSSDAGLAQTATNALLRAAVARARGTLRSLSVSELVGGDEHVIYLRPETHLNFPALLEAITANGGALRTLRVSGCTGLGVDEAAALLQAAPALSTLRAHVACYDPEEVTRVLRGVPPFERLVVERLDAFPMGVAVDVDVIAFAADIAAANAALTALSISHVWLLEPAALRAVVDAAIARRLTSLSLCENALTSESVPELARLLADGALTELTLLDMEAPAHLPFPLDAPSATALGAALRANTTLTRLTLRHGRVMNAPDAAAPLFAALAGHPRLTHLDVCQCRVPEQDEDGTRAAAAGALIGALVAANAPALTALDVSGCHLGDAGLAPLFAALPANSHLRELDCRGNRASQAFAADVLLPAVRANTALTRLNSPDDREWMAEIADGVKAAVALVLERTAAAARSARDAAAAGAGPSHAR